METTIDRLIACAKYANVAVKWGHAPRLSLIDQLRRVIDALGVSRLMWPVITP
jgi:hypothetical protein